MIADPQKVCKTRKILRPGEGFTCHMLSLSQGGGKIFLRQVFVPLRLFKQGIGKARTLLYLRLAKTELKQVVFTVNNDRRSLLLPIAIRLTPITSLMS